MKYQNLKTIFHKYSKQNWENEYHMRINHYSTFNTGINIQPIQDEKQKKEFNYPLFIMNTNDLVLKLEKINTNSNKIIKLSYKLPGIATESYFKNLLINELQSTNETENIRSTKQEIADALNDKTHYNKRFQGLVKQYNMLEHGEFVNIKSIDEIRKLFDNLVSNEIKASDQPDGKLFRTNGIGVFNESSGRWTHRNEYDEAEIYAFLTNLINYLNDDDFPILYRIMGSHYMFEYLHPFYDGNGRIGRYIVASFLAEYVDKFTALTFSYSVNRNQHKYYKAFEETSHFFNKGELTSFINIMFDILIEGQESIIEQMSDHLDMILRLEDGLRSLDLTHNENIILFYLLQDKIFGSKYSKLTLIELTKVSGLSRNKVNQIIDKHSDKLNEVKGKPKIYEISDAFVDALRNFHYTPKEINDKK
ncbi:Fic family protein [Macrococcus animalis]|uniref:Fic family protein n=1 Tax=Macrococcus animalis TaxID=3395467 RepID=UPI0039BEB3F0